MSRPCNIRPAFLMTDGTKEFLVNVNKTCPELVQTSWKPVESDIPTRLPNIQTKFGGSAPWVSDTYKWPSCKTGQPDQHHMSFLCQINLTDLPTEFKAKLNLWDGLFQCFYCTKVSCSPYQNCFDEVRIVPQEALQVDSLQYLSAVACKDLDVSHLPVQVQEYVHDNQDIWKPSPPELPVSEPTDVRITRGMLKKMKVMKPKVYPYKDFYVGNWERNEILEIPYFNELGQNAVALAKLGMTTNDTIRLSRSYLHFAPYLDSSGLEDEGVYLEKGEHSKVARKVKIRSPDPGIKIGGWIDWEGDDVTYPKCPDCPGSPVMDTLLLQLYEHRRLYDNEEAQHKGVGVGHVTLCPSCRKPALGWTERTPPLGWMERTLPLGWTERTPPVLRE